MSYYAPKECNEGLFLKYYDLSHKTSKNEFVLGQGIFSKILDVQVNGDNAFMKVTLVPSKV